VFIASRRLKRRPEHQVDKPLHRLLELAKASFVKVYENIGHLKRLACPLAVRIQLVLVALQQSLCGSRGDGAVIGQELQSRRFRRIDADQKETGAGR
jgi:hypothetical protein